MGSGQHSSFINIDSSGQKTDYTNIHTEFYTGKIDLHMYTTIEDLGEIVCIAIIDNYAKKLQWVYNGYRKSWISFYKDSYKSSSINKPPTPK